MNIKGFTIKSQLARGQNYSVYRAVRKNDSTKCVLKILEKEAARKYRLSSNLNDEFRLIQQVKSQYVINALQWIDNKELTCMVLEDIDGKPLKEYIKQTPFSVEQFITTARSIAAGVAAIHSRNIIHKDINSTNIVINEQTGNLKIIDFSIASTFDMKVVNPGNPETLQGTLPYISPEQTGRVNRWIDQRTDLYSMGVTFYEMLTGKLPFQNRNPMEVVYAHLAIDPVPPHLDNRNVPVVLSRIVLKLMAKDPEDRYQGIQGVINDLEKAAQLDYKEFELGENDFSGKLLIPETLYGRGKEIQRLMDAYLIARQGPKEMILVAGYSGAGKTALVKEIHKPITKDNGYFIDGKFDQLQRTVPYFAFIQAFSRFCQLVLSEKKEVLHSWKERILQAVGELGKVLTDFIPQMELIIGKQPDVPEVGGDEARKRFNYTFQQFLRAVSGPEHPLVLFIDDLQWADLASLELMQLLMEDRKSRHLLFVGAYRDNEVTQTHPLMMTLEDMQKTGTNTETNITTIPVKNLKYKHITHWLQDTLKITGTFNSVKTRLGPLARLIHQKTQGNAFFTIQFLENLYRENLLHFDFKQSRWQWDMDRIKKQDITDNVVDLLVRKILTLPVETQESLKLAACIGSVFDLHTLDVISQKEPEWHRANLEVALTEHLIHPFGDNTYKFIHDRIHQAAYSLTSDKDKKHLHLKIGRLLLNAFRESQSLQGEDGNQYFEQHYFDIVNHLNIGLDLIESEEERLQLARLNLTAAQKAKMSGAFKLSEQYVHIIFRLLPENYWEDHFNLTLAVYDEAVQASYLCGNYEDMHRYAEIVIERANDYSQTTNAYKHRIMCYAFAQNQTDRAVEMLLEVMNGVGIHIPKAPSQDEIMSILKEADSLLQKHSDNGLSRLPLMTDPQLKFVIQLFDMGAFALMLAGGSAYPYTVCRMVILVLEHGLTPEAPSILSMLGIMKVMFGDIPGAYKLGEIALELSSGVVDNESIKHRPISLAAAYIIGYSQHFKKAAKLLTDNYQYSLNVGDLQYCGSILDVYTGFINRTDTELSFLYEKANTMLETAIQIKQGLVVSFLKARIATQAALLGKTANPNRLDIDIDELSKGLPEQTAIFFVYRAKLKQILLSVLFEDYGTLADDLALAEEKWTAGGSNVPFTFLQSDNHFLLPIAYLQLYDKIKNKKGKEAKGKRKYLAIVKERMKTLQSWAEFGPVNFLHKYFLLQAEFLRVTGKISLAADYYDKSIETAYENEFIHEAAIANELAAKFYMKQNRHKLAALYFIEARDCYEKWGAIAKINHLEDNYPRYLSMGIRDTSLMAGTITTSSADTTGAILDVKSILKASQTLSGTIHLKSLLEKLMQILIENAGAQRCIMIENIEGRLFIQAEGGTNGVSAILKHLPIEESKHLPLSVVNYVARSKNKLVFNNISKDPDFSTDSYIKTYHPKSIVCFPILNKGELSAILYLENNLLEGAFTPARLEILNMLSSQIAISVENTHLYENLEEKVRQRTARLQKAHQALEKNHEELVQLTRFKEEMTSMIVHDLKNPLNSIIHFHDPKTGVTPVPVKNAGRQMLNLVMNILEVHKFEDTHVKPELAPHIIYDTADESIEEMRFLAREKNITIKNDIPRHLVAGMDQDMIKRVFVNLLTNAVKYTPINGSVTLSARAVKSSASSAGGVSHITSMIKISVSDNGEGIPKENLPSVFDRFQQVEARKSGSVKSTGIGLTYCKLAVEAHGGEISVNSNVGKGSTFSFTLMKQEDIAVADLQVSGSSKPMDTETTDNSIQLSETELNAIRPFIDEFKKLRVHQFSEIRDVLLEIDAPEGSALYQWKEDLQFTVYSCNQDLFDNMIREILEHPST